MKTRIRRKLILFLLFISGPTALVLELADFYTKKELLKFILMTINPATESRRKH